MAGQIIKRGKNTWMVRVFLGRHHDTGKRQYANQTVHGNKKDAEAKLLEMQRERNMGALTIQSKKLSIGELLDGVILDYELNEQSITWARFVVGHLRPLFGNLPANTLRIQHVDAYIEQRRAAGRKNATINREIAILRRGFSIAEAKGLITAVPIRFPKLRENNVRKGFFEHQDYLALRDALPAELKPVLTFAYYTGCRKSEILGLRWSQVDLLARRIRLEVGETKNGQGRTIPLVVEELFQAIAMQRALRDSSFPESPWVFSRFGEPILDFRGAWEKACEVAGLWETKTGTDGLPQGRPTKLFHDLRRTGVRNLIRAGVPEKVAMLISGHQTRSVFERYNIVDDRDVEDAMGKLDSYARAKSAAIGSRHTIGTQEANLAAEELRKETVTH